MSECGPGRMKMIFKSASGRTEDWDAEFTSDGAVWRGLDRDSGQTCKMVMEKYTNIFGKFRIAATIGGEEFLKALGNKG